MSRQGRIEGFQRLLDEMPEPEEGFFTVLSWCHRFNAYEHWVSGPEMLADLVLPFLNYFEERSEMHPGIGFDGIRAMLFWKARQYHFTDYPPDELLAVFTAARKHATVVAAEGLASPN